MLTLAITKPLQEIIPRSHETSKSPDGFSNRNALRGDMLEDTSP